VFGGPEGVPMVEWALAEVARGHRRNVVIVVPRAATWTLPAYELAIMARTALGGAPETTVSIVTAEREPLWIFGEAAAAAMGELLADRDITLHSGTARAHLTDDVLWLESGEALMADTVISLPRLRGPAVAGLPSNDQGFIPTDAHGYVMGAERVLAAGDATTFPVKQGGLATQQADAAAATIAHALGAPVEPRPFVPVLRGLLLTSGAPSSTRAAQDAVDAPAACAARSPRGRSGARRARLQGATSRRRMRRRATWIKRCTRSTRRRAPGGGVLPAAYAERRERWQAQLRA
jgi:sulfide:quinone oxidoreductase